MPTAAEVIARVRASRNTAKVADREAPLPFNDRTGGIVSGTHVVTAGEDTAGTLDIQTQLSEIESVQVEIRSAAGVMKNDDQVVTTSGGVITVADGATTDLLATDVIHWSAKGK